MFAIWLCRKKKEICVQISFKSLNQHKFGPFSEKKTNNLVYGLSILYLKQLGLQIIKGRKNKLERQEPQRSTSMTQEFFPFVGSFFQTIFSSLINGC